MRSAKIPPGWEFWASETGNQAAWKKAVILKQEREHLRRDLMVRVRVVPAGGAHWILRKGEPRQRERAA